MHRNLPSELPLLRVSVQVQSINVFPLTHIRLERSARSIVFNQRQNYAFAFGLGDKFQSIKECMCVCFCGFLLACSTWKCSFIARAFAVAHTHNAENQPIIRIVYFAILHYMILKCRRAIWYSSAEHWMCSLQHIQPREMPKQKRWNVLQTHNIAQAWNEHF